jgi:hypothetical protein
MRNYAYFTEKRDLGPTQNLNNQDILTIMATKDIDLRSNSRFGYLIQIMPCWH